MKRQLMDKISQCLRHPKYAKSGIPRAALNQKLKLQCLPADTAVGINSTADHLTRFRSRTGVPSFRV